MTEGGAKPRRRAVLAIAVAACLAAGALVGSGPALGAEQWIVAPAKNARATEIAHASGARLVDPVLGIWTASAPDARRLSDRLRTKGLLRFTERDVRVRPLQVASGQAAAGAWWRPGVLGAAGETPIGAIGPQSAPIAVMESGGFDSTLPDIPPSVTLRRPSTDPTDDTDHGTKVVSVIAGRGPSVFGVTPNADVRVYGSSQFCSDSAAAIRRAVSDGARVISMSYGFIGGGCLAHRVATSYASSFAVVIAAAGNERAQPWTQPANDLHVLTVGSLNALDQPTFFSNQSNSIDVSAPGEGIGVACPLASDTSDGLPDGFCTVSGTSFSAPVVAAVAARVIAARPDLSASQVQRLVATSARDIGGRTGWDISTGYGAVDLTAALAAPTPLFDRLEPNDDIEWLNGRHFRPDAALLQRQRSLSFRANLDALKDPMDVYPVFIGPFERVRATLRPDIGRMRIAIHRPDTKSVYARGSSLDGPLNVRPGRSGQVSVINRGPRRYKIWVAVQLPRGPQLLSDYRITLTRR